jgi:serine/threonine protein kinase
MARYRKNTKINSGGFGVVYRAIRVEDSEVVALKELAITGVAVD